MMTRHTWALQVPARPESCRRSRLELQRFLEPLLPDSLVQDAVLVLHELVANVVDHARTPMRLSAQVRDGSVRLAVRDGSPAPGRRLPHDPLAARGRGLQIVERLSRRWGIRPGTDGKTTWAELGPPGTARARPELRLVTPATAQA